MTAEKQLKEKVSYAMGLRNAHWPVNSVPGFAIEPVAAERNQWILWT